MCVVIVVLERGEYSRKLEEGDLPDWLSIKSTVFDGAENVSMRDQACKVIMLSPFKVHNPQG